MHFQRGFDRVNLHRPTMLATAADPKSSATTPAPSSFFVFSISSLNAVAQVDFESKLKLPAIDHISVSSAGLQ